MRAVLLALLVDACTGRPSTVRDAVDEYASGTCKRFVRCEVWTDSVTSCEDAVVEYFCSNLDCSAILSDRVLESIRECVETYQSLDCSTVTHVCEVVP